MSAPRKLPGKPIVYEASIEVRFSDLDVNGHLNASNYLDYVLSGRWMFFQKRFGMGVPELAAKGLGFYVSSVETRFKRSIRGGSVGLRSWVAEIRGARYLASYELTDPSTGAVYCDGSFEFVAIDLARGKAQPMPGWAAGFFFE